MISVCIATYNGAKYIGEQLASILPQLGPNDEVIISDDGSTDGTLAVVDQIGDERIRVIEGPHRHSPTHNFENALRHAKGNYIFLADQDDVWKPNKVQVCLHWLGEYDCVVSDAEVADASLHPIYPSLYNIMYVREGRWYNMFWKNGYTGCCMVFSKRVLEWSLPFPADIPMHDMWIGNVAASMSRVKFLPDKLICFRRHSTAASCNIKGSKYSRWQQLAFRWHIVKNILLLKIKASKTRSHRTRSV